MLAYVAKRLALAVGTVLAAVLITFLLVHAGNGTPGAVKAGPGATAAEIAAQNEALGYRIFSSWAPRRPGRPRSSTTWASCSGSTSGRR